MTSPLDAFIPVPDARERFAVTVRAPAATVYEVACNFDMQSIWSVRTIFQMRERIMGSRPGVRVPRGMVEELREPGMGLPAGAAGTSCSWEERSASHGWPT